MVTSIVTLDPVLARFREAAANIYGDRFARIVLFGSRARARLSSDFLEATGEFVNALAFRVDAYPERTPLMREIRRERVDF
jgi:hypothetical protein